MSISTALIRRAETDELFSLSRRALCADTAARFGYRKAFAFEMLRIRRLGIRNESIAFRLAALNIFGRAI